MQVRHRNIVPLVAQGVWPEESPKYLWIQMGFIKGQQLDTWAQRRNPSARAVAEKVLQVARGLSAIHAAGLVHCDVKGPNIIVRASDGEAILVDFDSISHSDAATPGMGSFPQGTAGYFSPETYRFEQQHSGLDSEDYCAGPADDLYAVGVVLYRLLTGRLPFDIHSRGYVNDVMFRPALPPHRANPRVPRALSSVCMRLLKKTPEARYASAVTLSTVLERLLAQADSSWEVPLLEARINPRDERRGHRVVPRGAPHAG
jgi:serine/threonine-protein kinase